MKRLLIGLIALLMLAAPVVAQSSVNPGLYEASPATLIEGQKTPLLTDVNRRLQVVTAGTGGAAGTAAGNADDVSAAGVGTLSNARIYAFDGVTWDRMPGTSAGGLFVQGNVASGVADSGNPVKVGGVYNTVTAPLVDGQRGAGQLGIKGALVVTPFEDRSSPGDGQSNSNYTASILTRLGTSEASALRIVPMNFNGSTWDREFVCASTATISVAAAATTQIVALSGSTVIRVCSFVISGDTIATTAKFVYGTGANCGTGTTDITAAMRLQDEGNIALSAGQGSLFRGLAANALCLTAAAGAVTGFVTYAQY